MLEFILHDLKGNRCEMMALVCFRMLIGVTIKNMGTQPLAYVNAYPRSINF
jgi:hypothetical protein